jgi:hypothetical protein
MLPKAEALVAEVLAIDGGQHDIRDLQENPIASAVTRFHIQLSVVQ